MRGLTHGDGAAAVNETMHRHEFGIQALLAPHLLPAGYRPCDMSSFRFVLSVRAMCEEEAAARLQRVVYVFGYGGLRFGEAAALRRRDCDLLRRRLHVARSASTLNGRVHITTPKSHKVRSVSLPTFVVEELARHLEQVPDDPDALVFTAPKGGALHYNNYRRNVWNPATEDAGLTGLTPHELRHTCASLLIAIGENPKSISAHLGHSSVAFTLDTYGHLFDGHMDDSMDSLDRLHREAERAPDNVRRIG